MIQNEAKEVLTEIKGFCERNITNRLSEDLCNALLGRVQSIIKIDQPQPTSAAQEAVKSQEAVNALP
jgi:hypothetical protein